MSDKILLPKELTAENGAKGLLSGEFSESIEIDCPEMCCGDDIGCEVCGGNGVVSVDVPVSWSTIKDIYKKIVEHYGSGNKPVCQHDFRPEYDHVCCIKCGAIYTDGGWGISSQKEFKNINEARFYQKNGRLPEPIG